MAFKTPEELYDQRQALYLEKMALDKQLSIYLDDNILKEDDTNTPAWIEYRSMLKAYETIQNNIRITEYYIGRL